MEDTQPAVPDEAKSTSPIPPVLAPTLMMVFWMLLGGAAGIKMMESIWRFRGVAVGEMTIAVPVGGAVGALAGALLGLIKNPRLLVLLMAVFAGGSAGGVAGQLPWGDVGQIGGQVAGGLAGGIAWAFWLFMAAERSPHAEALSSTRQRTGREQKGLHGVHEERHECLRCPKEGHGQRPE